MEQFGDIPDRPMTIESKESIYKLRRLKTHLKAGAWRNIQDTRDDGPAEGCLTRKTPIIETMRIGLSSTDMPILEINDNQS